MTTALRQIGVITRPHGLRGEVKVRPETDDPSRFEDLKAVWVGKDEEFAALRTIRTVRLHSMRSGVAVVLALEGVDDRDEAEALAGLGVWADESDLPPLDEGEVFISDLIGLDVFDEGGATLGRVTDVLDLPAQPVLVVGRPDGQSALVPFVPEIVEHVDSDGIVIRPIEGLLDPDRQEAEG